MDELCQRENLLWSRQLGEGQPSLRDTVSLIRGKLLNRLGLKRLPDGVQIHPVPSGMREHARESIPFG